MEYRSVIIRVVATVGAAAFAVMIVAVELWIPAWGGWDMLEADTVTHLVVGGYLAGLAGILVAVACVVCGLMGYAPHHGKGGHTHRIWAATAVAAG